MKTILQNIWTGLWQGIGVEFSFFMLWIVWHLFHRRVSGKLEANSFLHKIHEYFTK